MRPGIGDSKRRATRRASSAAVLVAATFMVVPVYPASPALPASPEPAQPSRLQSKSRPRLFEPLDLGLLDAPDREQWQKPEFIMDELKIAEGSAVAELGAGGGWFTIRLARRVGPNGVVFAEDIQPEMIEAMRVRLQHENLPNVRPFPAQWDPKLGIHVT